jgi:hypothetical protein
MSELEQEDPTAELAAMTAIANALAPLSGSGKVRVLRWAGDLFGAGISSVAPRVSRANVTDGNATSVTASVGEFGALADFYAAANPDTDARKTLVVAYWKQVRTGEPDVDSQSINTELKQLGFGVGNITRAFDVLKASRPQLIVQMRKDGTTKQARKRYKVTVEGQREVERMIAAGGQ